MTGKQDINVELREIYAIMCRRCRDKLKRLIADKMAERVVAELDAKKE